jgi:FkbM family methyltransferase
MRKVTQALNRVAAEWTVEGVVPVILDVGANVGYSSLFFADNFPQATIIAIEADHETFVAMQSNLADHRRIKPVHAAIWSHENGVDLTPPNRFGSWARRVASEAGNTPSLLLQSTLSLVENARPLIVKLDVEGAEREICASSIEIVQRVPCIFIEPHDFMLPGAGCLSPLFKALATREVDTLISGENLIFIDSKLSKARSVPSSSVGPTSSPIEE